MRWNAQKNMLRYWGQLPDAMGARFEATILAEADEMKIKGEPWAPFAQRAADALFALCDPAPTEASMRRRWTAGRDVQVSVPFDGPAEIAGIPIADSLLERFRPNASITPVLVDDDGAVLVIGRTTPALSPKVVGGAAPRRPGVGCRAVVDVGVGGPSPGAAQ